MPSNDTTLASSFILREELRVDAADLTLVALSTPVTFDGEVPDPWFNITDQATSSAFGETWSAPLGHSVLACLEQSQFCAGNNCSKLDTLQQQREVAYGLALTPEQTAVADLVWKSLRAAQLQYSLILMSNDILTAKEAVMGSWYMRSPKLRRDQRVMETKNLVNMSLAILQ